MFETESGTSPAFKWVIAFMALLGLGMCGFLEGIDIGVFKFLGNVGSAVLGVVDELWKQPEK